MKGKKSWKKSLNYLGRHTGEGQFAKTGKICLSRDVQNHGAKRQRREFPSQDMIPCATLYILNQGGSQYTADFFFLCLFTSGYINSNLLLRQREKEKMQASIPTPSSGIFLLLLGCSYLAGSSVTSHPLCLSLTGQ